jgi:hypothetical protein
MNLPRPQRRALTELERDLSGDPVLAEVAGLFAGPEPEVSTEPPEPAAFVRPSHRIRRRRRRDGFRPARSRQHLLVLVSGTLALLGGVANIVIAARIGLTAMLVAGSAMTAVAAAVLVGELGGVRPRPRRRRKLLPRAR